MDDGIDGTPPSMKVMFAGNDHLPLTCADASWKSCFPSPSLVPRNCKQKSNSCQESAERQIPRESYYNDEPEAKPRSIHAALDTE